MYVSTADFFSKRWQKHSFIFLWVGFVRWKKNESVFCALALEAVSVVVQVVRNGGFKSVSLMVALSP